MRQARQANGLDKKTIEIDGGLPVTGSIRTHSEITICYFSWIRESVGKESEQLSVPAEVTDISGLIDWLVRNGGAPYARAFENPDVTRAAINHCHVGPAASLQGAKEVAFFPPVTGG